MVGGRYGDFHSVFVWKKLFLDVFHAFVQLPRRANARVVYVHSQQFVQEMVRAIREGTIQDSGIATWRRAKRSVQRRCLSPLDRNSGGPGTGYDRQGSTSAGVLRAPTDVRSSDVLEAGGIGEGPVTFDAKLEFVEGSCCAGYPIDHKADHLDGPFPYRNRGDLRPGDGRQSESGGSQRPMVSRQSKDQAFRDTDYLKGAFREDQTVGVS